MGLKPPRLSTCGAAELTTDLHRAARLPPKIFQEEEFENLNHGIQVLTVVEAVTSVAGQFQPETAVAFHDLGSVDKNEVARKELEGLIGIYRFIAVQLPNGAEKDRSGPRTGLACGRVQKRASTPTLEAILCRRKPQRGPYPGPTLERTDGSRAESGDARVSCPDTLSASSCSRKIDYYAVRSRPPGIRAGERRQTPGYSFRPGSVRRIEVPGRRSPPADP